MTSNWPLEHHTLLKTNDTHLYKDNDIITNNISKINIIESNPIVSEKNSIKEISIKQKSKNRCNYDICKTKLGLVPFECRCQLNFCSEHRLPENHKCTFDYKTLGKSLIEKNNQKVIGEKIQKI
jgi:predicted nucleic acid binding AN1-type Zn finger protein